MSAVRAIRRYVGRMQCSHHMCGNRPLWKRPSPNHKWNLYYCDAHKSGES